MGVEPATVFTYATALARINNLEQPLFTPGITSGQQLQILNEVLDRMWTHGQWDGLLQEVSGLTTTNNILTLPPQYKNLTGLKVSNQNTRCWNRVSIKSQQWKFSPSANGTNWDSYCGSQWYAFDRGDSGLGELGVFSGSVVIDQATGIAYQIAVSNEIIGLIPANANPPSLSSARQYEIPGPQAYIDSLTFKGMAKQRYIYATDLNANVAPDSFEGLLMGVRAYHSYATGDTERAGVEFSQALEIVERDLGQILQDEDMGRVTVEYEFSGGSIPNLY